MLYWFVGWLVGWCCPNHHVWTMRKTVTKWHFKCSQACEKWVQKNAGKHILQMKTIFFLTQLKFHMILFIMLMMRFSFDYEMQVSFL